MSNKIGRKLVMLCKKAKDAEGKDVARNLIRHPLRDFRHPLKISMPSPETALSPYLYIILLSIYVVNYRQMATVQLVSGLLLLKLQPG